jgi:hypothetical protein
VGESLRLWAADLSPPERAAAAAIRVLTIHLGSTNLVRLHRDWAHVMDTRAKRGYRASWAVLQRQWWRDQPAPRVLAEVWMDHTRDAEPPRLPLPSIRSLGEPESEFAYELFEILTHLPGATSATALDTTGDPWRKPHWPLRIGVPGAGGAEELRSQLGHWDYLDIEETDDARPDSDLLVLDGPLEDELRRIEAQTTRPTTRFVVVAAGRSSKPEQIAPLARKLRQATGAYGVAVVKRDKVELARLVGSVANEIGHDRPLDTAVAKGARDAGAEVELMVGQADFLDTSSASQRVSELGKKLVSVGATRDVPVPDLETHVGWERVAQRHGQRAKPPDATPAPRSVELGTILASHAAEADWTHETNAAAGSARIARSVTDSLDEAARAAAPRYLQCQVSDAHEPHVEIPKTGEQYTLSIWIGPREEQSLTLPSAFPKISDAPVEHEIEVVVSDPRLFRAPRRKTIRLAPVGATERCEFAFRCGVRVKRVETRIIVLHRGRVLQTGVLRAVVARDDLAGEAFTFAPDAMPRTRLQKLDARSTFGAAIVANHGETGEKRKLAIVDGRVATIKLGESTLRALVDRFNAALGESAQDDADYKKLTSSGNVALIRDIAQHGAILHEDLASGALGPTLASKTRLQVVAARRDSFLPLELAYSYTAPEDSAELCDGSDEALRDGRCPKRCSLGGEVGGTDDRICPLGFWCMTKVIERYQYSPVDQAEPGDFALFGNEAVGERPELALPTQALVAASKNATAHDRKAIDKIMQVAGPTFTKAKDWDDWVKKVEAIKPSLLILLPHHLDENGASILELGENSQLKATNVKACHTVGKPRGDAVSPIVLLLGCETAQSVIALESFPAVFVKRGAAIVLATIATVLGRDASAAAVRLVETLVASKGDRAFGDLLIETRRQLVREGRVMALALAGFGDADWRIGDGGSP